MLVINVKGPIVSSTNKWIYSWFGMQATAPIDIEKALKNANGQDVVIEINSGGGEVFAGFEIYSLIKQYKGKIENHIIGLAGSAASVIAVSAPCKISPVGMVMIHNASTSSEGDYNEMDKTSKMLQTINSSIRLAYMTKTKIKEEELVNLMDKETWMNAREAIDRGFADEMLFDDGNSNSITILNASNDSVLDQKIIDRMQQLKNDNKLGEITSIINLPKGGEDSVNEQVINQPDHIDIENKGGKSIMTYAEICNQHPELQNEVEKMISDAEERGATNERERIREIDDIAGNISSDLVTNAKYNNPITAQQLAFNAMKENMKLGEAYMKNAVDDSNNSGANDVNSTLNVEDSIDEDAALADIAAKAANRKRGKVE